MQPDLRASPPTLQAPQPPAIAIAYATGFNQCAIAFNRALSTTPVGWLLTAWLCWGKVSAALLWGWLGVFGVAWAVGMLLMYRVLKHGAQLHLHLRQLYAVAVLDGAAWGAVAWFLMGHDPILDTVMVALLCGVATVNSQVSMTYTRAYYVHTGALWLVFVAGLLRNGNQLNATDYIVGFSVFVGLTIYYMRPIAAQLLEGIGLQLANASLTEQLRLALAVEQRDAATDPLTGQANRRALDVLMAHQMEVATRTGQAFSVLMLDIDFFKKVNDVHGHTVGDEALKAFALRVREQLRQADVCARYGGEEFVVVLPGALLPKALEVAQRIRVGVAQAPLLTEPRLDMTVSIGAATLAPGQTAQGLLQTADAAVYAAKRAGRNRVAS